MATTTETKPYDAKKAINEIEWMTDYLASQIDVEGISNSARVSYAREINQKKDELIAYIEKLEQSLKSEKEYAQQLEKFV